MSHLVLPSDDDDSANLRLRGYNRKAPLDILFHSDTDVLVNLCQRRDPQRGDFILLYRLAHVKYVLSALFFFFFLFFLRFPINEKLYELVGGD